MNGVAPCRSILRTAFSSLTLFSSSDDSSSTQFTRRGLCLDPLELFLFWDGFLRSTELSHYSAIVASLSFCFALYQVFHREVLCSTSRAAFSLMLLYVTNRFLFIVVFVVSPYIFWRNVRNILFSKIWNDMLINVRAVFCKCCIRQFSAVLCIFFVIRHMLK